MTQEVCDMSIRYEGHEAQVANSWHAFLQPKWEWFWPNNVLTVLVLGGLFLLWCRLVYIAWHEFEGTKQVFPASSSQRRLAKWAHRGVLVLMVFFSLHFLYFHHTVDIRPWLNWGHDATMEVAESGSNKLVELTDEIPKPGHQAADTTQVAADTTQVAADSTYVLGPDEEIPEGYTRESWQKAVNRPIGVKVDTAKVIPATKANKPVVAKDKQKDDDKEEPTVPAWRQYLKENVLISLAMALLIGILVLFYTKKWNWQRPWLAGVLSSLASLCVYWTLMILVYSSENITWVNAAWFLAFLGHGWWRLSVSAFKPKYWNRDVDQEGNPTGDPKPHIWGIFGCVLWHSLMALCSFFDYWTFYSILVIYITWVIGGVYVINIRELWAITVFRKPVYWRVFFFFRHYLKNGMWPSMIPSWLWETRVIVIPHELLEVNPWDTEKAPTETTTTADIGGLSSEVIPGPELVGRFKMSVIRHYPSVYLSLSAEDRQLDSNPDQSRGIQGVMKRHVMTAFTKITRQLTMEEGISKGPYENRENRDYLTITLKVFRIKLLPNKWRDVLIKWLTPVEKVRTPERPTIGPIDPISPIIPERDKTGNSFVNYFLRPIGRGIVWTMKQIGRGIVWTMKQTRPFWLWVVKLISEPVSIDEIIAKLANDSECNAGDLRFISKKYVAFRVIYKIKRQASFFEYVANELKTQTGVRLVELEVLDITPADRSLIEKYADIKLAQLEGRRYHEMVKTMGERGKAAVAELQQILEGLKSSLKLDDDASTEELREALNQWFTWYMTQRQDDRLVVLGTDMTSMIKGLISNKVA